MVIRRVVSVHGLATAAVVVGVLALCAGAGMGAAAADVKLQVVPRGPGTVTSSVPDKTTGATVCKQNSEELNPQFCDWTFSQGTPVVLTATPVGSGASFAGWSTPDCPGTGACQVTVDGDQSVVALFSKLRLEVELSGDNGDELITSKPAGITCGGGATDQVCEFRLRCTVDRPANRRPEEFHADKLPLRVHIGGGQGLHRDDARLSTESRSDVQQCRWA